MSRCHRIMFSVDYPFEDTAIAAAFIDTAPVSDAYHDVGLQYVLGVLFLVLASVAIWPGLLGYWWRLLIGWSTPPTMRELMTLLLGICLAKFLAVLFILKWMPLRLALTPGPTKTRRVRRRATVCGTIRIRRAGPYRADLARALLFSEACTLGASPSVLCRSTSSRGQMRSRRWVS